MMPPKSRSSPPDNFRHPSRLASPPIGVRCTSGMARSCKRPPTAATPLRVLRDVPNRPTIEPLVRLSTGDLPRELTTFIGREREIAQVARDLPKTRLLTLTGPGGVGKTRLALEVADKCRSDYADGACFVYLAPIVHDTSVPPTVLAALGLKPEPDRAELSTLIGPLRTCQLLLPFDYRQHLLSRLW